MKALDALHSRISFPKLNDPIPEQEVLDNIYKSAFRAADHAVLRPWRFLVIKGESRARLGELFVSAASTDRPDITEAEKLKLKKKMDEEELRHLIKMREEKSEIEFQKKM